MSDIIDKTNKLLEAAGDLPNGNALQLESLEKEFNLELDRLFDNAGLDAPWRKQKITGTAGRTPDYTDEMDPELSYYRVTFFSSKEKLEGELTDEVKKEWAKNLAFKTFEATSLRTPVGVLAPPCYLQFHSSSLTHKEYGVFFYVAFRLTDYDGIMRDMVKES